MFVQKKLHGELAQAHLEVPPMCSGGHLACRILRHLAAKAINQTDIPTSLSHRPPGWKPGDTAAKDGCRYEGSASQNIAHSCFEFFVSIRVDSWFNF